MKHYFKTLVKSFLFWLLFFFVVRSLFLVWHHSLLADAGFTEQIAVFYHALSLDISTICYLLTIPLLLFSVQLFFNHKIISFLIRVVVVVELLFASILSLAEIGIYGEWLCKLNYKALLYLHHPEEIFATASTSFLIFAVFAILLLTVSFYILYVKIVLRPEIAALRKSYWKAVAVALLMPGVFFAGMRGGINAIPISQSAACFSNHNVLNDAAINPLWNIVYNVLNFGSLNEKTAYRFMDSQEAEDIVNELHYAEKDTLVPVLKHNKINVVIILLESWTADLIESLTETKDVTPNFHALEKEGLLFTRFYSNGHRSQQAISSLLSSFPPVPHYDITANHDKYKHLPTFSDVLQQQQYNTSFYFGGNLNYGNIRSFLYHANFKKIVEEKNLGHVSPHGKLGIHDEYLFMHHANELSKTEEPFFSILFTLSSHSPYDQPQKIPPLQWDVAEINYLNSAKYTDYWLGIYFEEVKKQSWYDNTLFIIVADHSHPSHLGRNYYSKEYQHVPMLWVGNVLKEEYVGQRCGVVSSHIDIAPTLLNQLGYSKEVFRWGKDIFNPYYQHFAYFEVNNGFGFITDSSSVVHYSFDNINDSRTYFVGEESQKEPLLKKGKAYSQYLFETYLSY
ncbi:MAG: sulfatase-like hydrolase/transferase [Lentimicrobiaceae bacterium]|nr:sulfatase-like hydrolase/transferase [Lentimicrobiaceae bacterium]